MPKTILLDRNVFEEAYVPEKFTGRKHQIRDILRCLRPMKNGDFAQYVFIYGPPGVGKTTVTRHILKQHFGRKFAYVNCFRDRTSHKIMEEVMLQAGIMISGKESTRDMIKKFEKSRKRLIICLDESDYIKDTDILGVFVRNLCGLILISNECSFSKIDPRLRNRLFFHEIEFKPYNLEDTHYILKDRIIDGLRSGCISDNLLALVSKICNGDARIGLQTLKMAANEAETNNSDTINIAEIKSAATRTRRYRRSLVMGELNDPQLKILEILKEGCRTKSGNLLKTYRQMTHHELQERSYRNYMAQMTEFGLVKEKGTTKAREYEILI